MRRTAIAISVVMIFATVCGGSVPSFAAQPSRDPDGARQRKARSTVSIYSAVIHRLITVDHTFGGTDPEFDALYVIDGVVETAGAPRQSGTRATSERGFGPLVKAGLRKALEDLPPITFVKDRTSVTTGQAPGHVRGHGVLLTLGPIRGAGKQVEVPNSLWISGLAGQWLTYVVERRGSRWQITGNTGPVVIS